MEKEEIEHLQALRTLLQQRLSLLETQGAKADPSTAIEIADLKGRIASIETRLSTTPDQTSQKNHA
jgi:hypothetical protein